ncbi:MAG: methyltransferase domain-containing protein [Candidatus Magnetomorum sp.]|nr:methyltransferase domain-containing protein [Candidatus Magnetomorum sp.]
MKKVLNVGGNSKAIALPKEYEGWEHILLDIDATNHPDIIADARELTMYPSEIFDAVYCSHNLEHYYEHDAKKVLKGFYHVLKPDGFVHLKVPDMKAVLKIMVDNGMDIDDVLYQSQAGPIRFHDVIFGYGVELERSGQDYFAHKSGFTEKKMLRFLQEAHFPMVYMKTISDIISMHTLHVLAFKKDEPDPAIMELFELPKLM